MGCRRRRTSWDRERGRRAYFILPLPFFSFTHLISFSVAPNYLHISLSRAFLPSSSCPFRRKGMIRPPLPSHTLLSSSPFSPFISLFPTSPLPSCLILPRAFQLSGADSWLPRRQPSIPKWVGLGSADQTVPSSSEEVRRELEWAERSALALLCCDLSVGKHLEQSSSPDSRPRLCSARVDAGPEFHLYFFLSRHRP